MKLSEQLYRLTQIDLSGVLCEMINRQTSSAAVSANVTATPYVVPRGQVLVLHSMWSSSNPNAAEQITEQRLGYLIQNAAADGVLAAIVATLAANVNGYCTWEGEVWLPEYTIIRAATTFTPGAASNSVIAGITGLLIPRGSILL